MLSILLSFAIHLCDYIFKHCSLFFTVKSIFLFPCKFLHVLWISSNVSIFFCLALEYFWFFLHDPRISVFFYIFLQNGVFLRKFLTEARPNLATAVACYS